MRLIWLTVANVTRDFRESNNFSFQSFWLVIGPQKVCGIRDKDTHKADV